MLNVSTGFMSEMIASIRQVFARIIFRQVDVTAIPDCTATSTDTESISSPSNMIDEIDDVTTNYATFETDRFLLDGSFSLLPSVAPYDSMGWWSDALSDSTTRVFTPNVTNTFTFTIDHTSLGMTIFFDTTNEEYAEDFDIIFYDSSNNVLDTVNETGNTESLYAYSTTVTNYRKIEVVIKKWSKADRRARIEEVAFGTIKYYNDGEITNLKIVEELDIVSKNIPANQIDFSIDNSNGEYDILNPTGIYTYLQEQQPIDVYLGARVGGLVEYAQMGKYYLSEWATEQNQLEAKFTALDRLNLLQQKTYYKGLKASITLYDLAEDVLQDFGLTSLNYNIDTALQSVTINSFLPICTYREALQYIAVAGQCVLYADRTGDIQLVRVGTTPTGEEIDFANSYNSPKIELDKYVKQIDVDMHTFTEASSATEIYKGELNVSGTKSYWIVYSNPATTHTSSVTSGTIDSITYYTNACYVTITAVGNTTLTVNGKQLTTNTTPITTAVENDGETLTVKSQLISNTTLALSVGTWVKGEIQKRSKFTSNWRMNPAFELCDLVDVENQFTTFNDARIYKQEFNYNGALKGITEARG